MRRVLGAVLLLCVLLAAAAGGAVWYAQRLYVAPGPLPEARDVVVPHGGVDQVAEALARAGVIGPDKRPFRLAALATRGDGALHAAELAFPAHASLRQVLTVLREGHPVQHHVTIPEGLTAAQIAEVLDRAEALTGDPVLPREGEMLPETYSYEYGTSREAIVNRARAAMDRTLARLWAARAPDLPLSTPRDALILASIVERETARPEERPRIAAVFENRLRQGMKLQSDPTVIYGASGGMGELNRPLSRADLERDDPYNTYRIQGLPPGPICAPGLASLEAVTRPARTEDLYFVADGTGGHAFARTLAEHQKNVARWRALGAEPVSVER